MKGHIFADGDVTLPGYEPENRLIDKLDIALSTLVVHISIRMSGW